MKNINLLLVLAISFLLSPALLCAEEVEIYYPDFRYATVERGFVIENKTAHDDVKTQLWKRAAGDMPDPSLLGHTRNADQQAISSKAYTATTSYATESYAIVTPVDLSTYPSTNDFKVTFWTKAQYQLGENGAQFSVHISANYGGSFDEADWMDVTNHVDTIDQATGYDGEWVKSTLSLNDYKDKTVTIAFGYMIPADGVVDADNRPGLWKVSDVRFTTESTINLDNYTDVQAWDFSDFNLLRLHNTVGADGSNEWVRNSGTLPPDAEAGANALKTGAVQSGENTAIKCWAILGSVDCSTYENVLHLSFWDQVKFKGADATSALKVMVSTDYVPADEGEDRTAAINAAEWTDVSVAVGLNPENHDPFVENTGFIDAGGNASVYVAFVYENTTTDEIAGDKSNRASSWWVADVLLKGEPKIGTGQSEMPEANALSLYPNPATEAFSFSREVNNVTIYTLEGQLVYSKNAPTQRVDVSAFAKGVYFVTTTDADGNKENLRLIVE